MIFLAVVEVAGHRSTWVQSIALHSELLRFD